MKTYDVIIIGGGMVGSSLACLLAKAGLHIAVIEAFATKPFDAKDADELRVSAISHFSQSVLKNAGAWAFIEQMRLQPYEQMHVWDGTGTGKIHFDAAEIGEPQLGHIIENRIIQLGLQQAIEQYENIELFCPARLKNFTINNKTVFTTLDNDEQLSATLIVGADGARSYVRELAKTPVNRNDYGQSGLVTVVETELPHQNTAWQRFIPTGPIAFLPLNNNHSSIVWTLPSDQADYMLSLEDKLFEQKLAEAIDYKLGSVHCIAPRAAFPLKGSQAEQYVKANIALVGDAAHTIHPLAGLGVNLGFKDAAKLAEILSETSSHSQIGEYKVLRRYERARRGDNVITMKAMEAFRSLFGNTLNPVQQIRNFGLNWINQNNIIKHAFMQQAMGK